MMKKKRLGGKTCVGRLMKRLLGDTAGGVLMEYVVLGLLIVSAVVAAVMVFGESIQRAFTAMADTTATTKTNQELQEQRNNDRAAINDGVEKAATHRESIQNR
jgi:Flp pilus assembly pilin Flp